jgi:hypothetical protein
VDAFVVVRRHAGLEEALVAFSLLRSAGIEAEIDHHHAAANSIWGGPLNVDLRVPTADAADALTALNAVDAGDLATPDVAALKRRWSTRVRAGIFLVWFFGLEMLLLGALFGVGALFSLSATRRSAAHVDAA